MSRHDIGAEDVRAVGVWVAEEVGESYDFEGVRVGVGLVVEFDHVGRGRGLIMLLGLKLVRISGLS